MDIRLKNMIRNMHLSMGRNKEEDMSFIELQTKNEEEVAVTKDPSHLKRLSGYLLKLLLLFVLFIGFVIGILLVAEYYVERYAVSKHVVNNRPCVVTKGEHTVEGTRTYRQMQKSLFGYVWHSADQVEIKTVVSVPYSGITIVGINDTDYITTKRGKGEGGILPLELSDTYVFLVDGEAIAISDVRFCK